MTGQDKYILVKKEQGEDKVSVKDVTLGLPDGSSLVEHFSMTLNKGDRLILTGPSGSGKSTLAKAILNLWDYGEGQITLPSDATVMAVSQKAYFPNTTVRGILSAPQPEGAFEDEKLVEVLRAVGHEKLIQHIPGAQIKIAMDDILTAVPAFMKEYEYSGRSQMAFQQIKEVLGTFAEKKVHSQLDTIQYTPDEQKEYFRQRLDTLQKETLRRPMDDLQIEELATHIVDKIDCALTNTILDKVLDKACDAAQRHASKSVSKLGYFTWNLDRSLGKSIEMYRTNRDTDDQSREIIINKVQASYMKDRLVNAVEEKLRKEHCRKGVFRTLFNAVTWPLSVLYQPINASKAAKDIKQDLSVMLEAQKKTGVKLAGQLSGGEQQKMMFARVLLHKPDILILDEITAALDIENGDKLYQDMVEKLPDTIMISIAHNKHIIKHHTHHAQLDPEKKTITVKPLQP